MFEIIPKTFQSYNTFTYIDGKEVKEVRFEEEEEKLVPKKGGKNKSKSTAVKQEDNVIETGAFGLIIIVS